MTMRCMHLDQFAVCRDCGLSMIKIHKERARALDAAAREAIGCLVSGDLKGAEKVLRAALSPASRE